MSHRVVLLLALVCVAGAPTTGRATIRPTPVKVRVSGPHEPARAGELFEARLEFRAGREAIVSDLRMDGEGWSEITSDAPASARVGPGATLVVTVRGRPADPRTPLRISFLENGRPRLTLAELSREAMLGLRAHPLRVLPRAEWSPFPAVMGRGYMPAPAPPRPRTPEREAAIEAGAPQAPADATALDRPIRVYGRMLYTRPDGKKSPAYGVSLAAYDVDPGSDDLIGQTLTDPDGYFEINGITNEPAPQIYLECVTANNAVVVEEASTWEDDYEFDLYFFGSTSGDVYYGDFEPFSGVSTHAVGILTQLMRARLWMFENGWVQPPLVDVRYPDDGSYYDPVDEEISIHGGDAWDESTQIHEFGHHWINNQAVDQEPDYCNGICDNPGDCGHCIWCRETDHDAWNEGWPDWFSEAVTLWFPPRFPPAYQPYAFEVLAPCGPALDDPARTEGFMAALLHDLQDVQADDHFPADPWYDRLALGVDEIYAVTDYDHPLTPWDFIAKFRARYPQHAERFWETAKNVGYDFDATPPGAPTGLTSTSHAPGFVSPDPTVDLVWTRPTDDASGVYGYSIEILTAPQLPSPVVVLYDVTTYRTAPIPPGTWYFSIRTMDKAGRWSPSYATFGPIVIRNPEPSNLVHYQDPSWGYVVVPRPAADATLASAPAPTVLYHEPSPTWWNARAINDGEQPTSGTTRLGLYVDGAFTSYATVGSLSPMNQVAATNRGPVYVRGGRHTFESRLDDLEQILEQDETDNAAARQWIWSPWALAANAPVTLAPLPDAVGGWGAIAPGDPIYFNCDGLRFTTSGWWNAVAIHSQDYDEDYDCRLHAASTGAGNGFGANVGWSTRAAGCLDAVLVNKNVMGDGAWDVGVLDISVGDDWYVARHVTSVLIPLDFAWQDSLRQNEFIMLREFYVDTGHLGPLSLVVDADPPWSKLRIQWLGHDFSTGDLLDFDAEATTDASGRARLDLGVNNVGYHCLVVYRDPKEGTWPLAVRIGIHRTEADLMPAFLPGWHSPLVPRPAPDGTATSVPLPTSLPGEVTSTYLNLALRNDGPTFASEAVAQLTLDGGGAGGYSWTPLAAWTTVTRNATTPVAVRGGRHALAMRLDVAGVVDEVRESNNAHGEQYVWSPISLAVGVPVTRAAPPDPVGGWADVTAAEPLYYNCDGLRTPVFAPSGEDGFWGAVALMPLGGDDADLRLHEVQAGVKTGFDWPLVESLSGPGFSELVMANFNATGFRGFDAGVLRTGPGTGSYTAEVATSAFRGAYPAGPFGPFNLPAGRIVHLHEFYLPAGSHAVRVENVSGAVDWGVTLHDGTLPYLGKHTGFPGGSGWFGGPGEDENLTVLVPVEGYHCISVWKVGQDDLGTGGSYRLWVAPGVIGAGERPLPGAVALAPPSPNPASAVARIPFALPRAARVRLELFDQQGRRVATLADGFLDAGTHVRAWDGRDEAGRPAPSGIYFVRLEVEGRLLRGRLVWLR